VQILECSELCLTLYRFTCVKHLIILQALPQLPVPTATFDDVLQPLTVLFETVANFRRNVAIQVATISCH